MTSAENHRNREKGVLVYPVYSRRSGGLSVGINLFPDKKQCSFDCPYCEVFPFSCNAEFSLARMETDLKEAVSTALKQNIPVKDICFSGNGEPTMSADFPEALESAGSIRREMATEAELVLITNGTGLLDDKIFSLLRDAATGSLGLNIWLKLDAGTPGWYEKMNCSNIPHEKLIGKIKDFSASAPVTIQTMLCAVDGEGPPIEETESWECLMKELVSITKVPGLDGEIRKVQIYGKARPSPMDPKTTALPVKYLEDRAGFLRLMLETLPCKTPPVEVYP